MNISDRGDEAGHFFLKGEEMDARPFSNAWWATVAIFLVLGVGMLFVVTEGVGFLFKEKGEVADDRSIVCVVWKGGVTTGYFRSVLQKMNGQYRIEYCQVEKGEAVQLDWEYGRKVTGWLEEANDKGRH